MNPGTHHAMPELPRFADLPTRAGLACAWGIFGPGDVLGTLNLLTPARIASAAGEIRNGLVFPLDMPLTEPDPPLYGRSAITHQISVSPGFGGVEVFQDDLLSTFNTQTSSQWDGFRHVSAVGHGFYNNLADDLHGIQHWSEHGIVGRAVIADIGRWREAQGRPVRYGEPDVIEAREILDCLSDQGVAVETGDILLIRTGWPAWWRGLPREERAERARPPLSYVGLGPGADVAEVLWNLRLAAVASDTPALEVGPASAVLPRFDDPIDGDPVQTLAYRTTLHVRLLVLLGMPIGELFELEALADSCAADGRYSGLLTSAPLRLPGGIASPPNAVVVR
jgi:kynurenine formamidase